MVHLHTLRIRDLNDEINKLIREKGHWERRIVELGGPDYSKAAPKVADSRGREVAEMTGGKHISGGSACSRTHKDTRACAHTHKHTQAL